MKLFGIVALALIALVGCETIKIPTAMGGSKADATVVMGYEYGAFERPVIDWDEAELEAGRVCRNWGYGRAELFGGTLSECAARNQYGCVRWIVSVQYQCLSEPSG